MISLQTRSIGPNEYDSSQNLAIPGLFSVARGHSLIRVIVSVKLILDDIKPDQDRSFGDCRHESS
jgi:hypothetical protein